jgi:SAM-dependent methyltransferase
MKPRLEKLLICPECRNSFQIIPFYREQTEIVDGLLISHCGKVYPIVNNIPRILPDALEEQRGFKEKYKKEIAEALKSSGIKSVQLDRSQKEIISQKSFGYQWTTFSEIGDYFKENFLNYIYPIKPDFFSGKLGLDAGCGAGRHIYFASQFGAEMVGIDFSDAIDTAYKNNKDKNHIHFIQADILNLPFPRNAFDFVYSLGVLHHLPDPLQGFQHLVAVTKMSIFIWVYSKKRRITNLLLEKLRHYSHRLPHNWLYQISYLAAMVEWLFLIQPYKKLSQVKSLNKIVTKITFPRIKLYSQYPFQVSHTDWFDRLAAPIRFYYDEGDLTEWAKGTGLKNVVISPTGLYGWRMYGEKG